MLRRENKEISVETSRRKDEGIEVTEYNISHRELYILRGSGETVTSSTFLQIRMQRGKKKKIFQNLTKFLSTRRDTPRMVRI